MRRNKPQFARLVQLDEAIRSGRCPNALTFSADYECSQKTIQRDIEYLRDRLGAPLVFDRLHKGYRYTRQNWFLPSLHLSEADLYSLLFAYRALEQYHGTPIAEELKRVFKKFVDSLPDKLAISPELIFSRFSFTLPPSKPVDEKIWTVVVQSLLQQWSLQIKYRSLNTKETTQRIIDPYHVANLQGEWYVFAWCHNREAVLQFGVPQMEEAILLEQRFEIPATFAPDRIVESAFRRHALGGKPQTVRLLFSKEVADRVMERAWHSNQKARKRADGRIELEFPAAGLFEVAPWVLAWGHKVRVLAPAELKRLVADDIKQMADNL